jgi:tRNA-splicing ligase RtcB (3'-phosphate/5'-hydroxy nucleic acid ligase)
VVRVDKHVRTISGAQGHEARLWVPHPEFVEDKALEQVRSMLEMPQLAGHLAIMPDVHWGKGASIGTVMALDGAIVPNCVGVDIGCGMAVYPLGMEYHGEQATRHYWRSWLGLVMRAVPSGFDCHDGAPAVLERLQLEARAERGETANSASLRCAEAIAPAKKFGSLQEQVLRQQGTMGGGNHFLEVQRDDAGRLWLMVHSGSRNTGLKIAEHYAAVAQRQVGLRNAPSNLHWLELSGSAGQDYLHDMQWAVDYALLNRKSMLRAVLHAMDLEFDAAQMINIPHNYAAEEEHFGRRVVVHRKGATSARVDELGIIPGSMGTPSYIVRGLGNPESYSSCSHGAGRTMGRKEAMRTLNTDQFAAAVKDTFSTPSQYYLDEAPQAYKNIDLVLSAQDELVTVVHKLQPVVTLKSGDASFD